MSEMEKELEGGISDDTATAAAEQALMEAANTMTEQRHDVSPDAAEEPAADDAAAQTADESTDKEVEEAAAALAAAQEAIAAQAKQIDGRPVPKEVQQEIDNAQEALAAEAAKLFARQAAGQK